MPLPRLAEAGAGPGAVEGGLGVFTVKIVKREKIVFGKFVKEICNQPVPALSVLIDTSLLSFSFSFSR